MDEERRQRLWRLYGWFSGLMMCGSTFGVVTWVARIHEMQNLLNANDTNSRKNFAEGYRFGASYLTWLAAFGVLYAVEFMCLSVAKLMVLDRMADFAAPLSDDRRKLWALGVRAVMAVVALGNVVGLVGNAAAAVFFQKSSIAISKASELYAANNTGDGDAYRQSARDDGQLGTNVSSVQSFSEVAVLLLIVAAFGVVGLLCARRIVFSLQEVNAVSAAAAAGKTLRLQIVVTTGFVFVAFLLRAVVSTMLAVANQGTDSAVQTCPGVQNFCDPSCHNAYAHIATWEAYTPEFRPAVELISSPLALLVALWGMTSGTRGSS